MVQTSPSPPADPDTTTAVARKRSNRPLIAIFGIVLVVLALGAGWYWLRPAADTGRLNLSGRLEGYETDVGARVPGRVLAVSVREGDAVKKGQLIVRLDDAELQAQLAGAAATLAAARQTAQQARLQINVLENQVREANFNLQQSQGDTLGRIAQAEATVETARAQLAQAEAQVVQARSELKLARTNRDRSQQLQAQGAVAQQALDQNQTALEAAEATLSAREAAVAAAQKQVSAAQGSLTQTRTTRFNPAIRNTQIDIASGQLAQARSQLLAAQSQEKASRAVQTQLQAQQAYLTIVSPIDGVVTARSVEPGAVVTTGKTLLSLLDLRTVYLRGYIPEGQIGKVRVGQAARVYLDSSPDQPLPARVSTIDPQASFTPENIYFRDERVRQVFGVKLILDKPGGFAKPGMPAEAEILLEAGR